MTYGNEKAQAVRDRLMLPRRISDNWLVRDGGRSHGLFVALLDHGIDYTLDAHDGEHRARIYYRDKHGTRVQTEAKDRDAFTALRDALYQWVKATEDDG